MLDLYRDDGVTLRIYDTRIPRKDGSSPTMRRAAAFVILMTWSVIAAAHTPPGAVYKLLVYGMIVAAGTWYLVSRFNCLAVSRRTRAIYREVLGMRRKVADLSDIDDILILQQEFGGDMHFCYAGVWRRDRYRAPVRLTPLCATMNQLSQYQRSIIPLVREQLRPRLNNPLNKGVTGEAPPPRTETAQEDEDKQPKVRQVFENTFLLDVILPTILYAVAGGAVVWVFWRAGFGTLADYPVYGLSFFGLFAIKYIVLAYYLLGLYRRIRRDVLRNVSIRIDREAETIEVATQFGLVKKLYTFDSVAYISVKGFTDQRVISLVLEKSDCDAFVTTTYGPAGTRKAVRELCAMLDVDPWQWVDILRHIHEWRFNTRDNPYREWDRDFKYRVKPRSAASMYREVRLGGGKGKGQREAKNAPDEAERDQPAK